MRSGAVAWHQRAAPQRSAIGGNRTLRALCVGAPVLAAVTFNMLLCFLNTRGLSISVGHVQIAEIAIIGSALFVGRRVVVEQMFIFLVLMLAYLCTLWIFSAQIDAKLVRDLIIPFAFFALGRSVAGPDDADRIVYILLVLVFTVALFEWLSLATFLRYFDVINYYVNKGAVEIAQTRNLENNLFVSGIRPEGRTLLPALGDHRVSSIFLEPVSTGNFAAIAFFWLCCQFKKRPRLNTLFLVICAAVVVLADGRFAAAASVIVVAAQLWPFARTRTALLALPIAVIMLLLGVAWKLGGSIVDDSLIGRLDSSGMVLWSFEPLEWLGLEPRRAVTTLDSGFSYLFSNFGVVGAAAVWAFFVLPPAATRRAEMLRSCIALYAGLSLSISASMYTIKTAALLWFLFGAIQNGYQHGSVGPSDAARNGRRVGHRGVRALDRPIEVAGKYSRSSSSVLAISAAMSRLSSSLLVSLSFLAPQIRLHGPQR